GDEQVPLGDPGQRGEHGGAGAVHRLEGRAAPDAEVDAATTCARAVADAAPVDAALPRHVPGGVVALGPLALQQRLGRAVATLLAQVGAHGRAAMVQDDGAGAEAGAPAVLLQPPADVDVIARGAELRIEAADRLEVGLAHGEVAARQVLGLGV